MGYFKEQSIEINERLASRIEKEINQGFDSADEMKEVFKEIADDFDVPVATVWDTYYNDFDYNRVSDYDGNVDEYTEWQDYMGGDDWDHGQYDG